MTYKDCDQTHQKPEHHSAKTSILEKILRLGDKTHVSTDNQIRLLNELAEFGLGQYYLEHADLNAYWSHYLVTHPWFGRQTGRNIEDLPFTSLEDFLLNRSPSIKAQQERFAIFLRETQPFVKNGATLASYPSAMMAELLYLDYTQIDNIRLIGLDQDFEALECGQALADALELSRFTNLMQGDFHQYQFAEEFDLLLTPAIGTREANDEALISTYRACKDSMKSNGAMLTSFLTHPLPEAQTEWDQSNIFEEDLLLDQILFADILEKPLRIYRSTAEMQIILHEAGFPKTQVIYDQAKISPSILAYKTKSVL